MVLRVAQLTSSEFPRGVVALVGLPCADIPDDHVARPVAVAQQHALEVEIVEVVVLDVDREPPHPRVQRRPLGHRPTDQDPVNLETQVIVQPTGPVPLHDKTPHA